MTCIAAIADSKTGKVWMGADSTVTSGSSETEAKDSKIWSVSWNDKTWLLGFTGSNAVAQLIRYQAPLPTEKFHDDDSIIGYLSRNWIPKIRELADKQRLTVTKDGKVEYSLSLIIASQGRLFEIDSRLSIIESPVSHAAMGSGGHFANGVLWYLEQEKSQLSPAKRIRKAIKGASRFCTGVGGRIDILSA